MGIASFTDREQWVVRTTAEERWGKEAVELHEAEVEVRLGPEDMGEVSCPALFWKVQQCHYVVIKTGESRYRCRFFYSDLQQMTPDVTEYEELAECMVQLLQVQADYARATARMQQ